ncbi:hypothetical protein [Denitromonas sp.]|uniref:hypothetical protein n=1 Tax=Denitromonas sp. TaxID=2734609 RepID=UPI003A8C6F10
MMDQTSLELAHDCLKRIENGDAEAMFDLASVFMSHADSKNVDLYLVVVEALAASAMNSGLDTAKEFLNSQWPEMKPAFRRRWLRAGLTELSQPT